MVFCDFNSAKILLKSGIFMRRRAWGNRCFIYYDIKTDKYYTQCGNEIKLNRKSYTGTYDWERLTDYLERLNKKFNYDRDTYSETYQNMLKINRELIEGLKNE